MRTFAPATALLLAGIACQVTFRDDVTYRCSTDADCAGDGYTCTPSGSAKRCCKPTGEEVCDHFDNDCDGEIDNTGRSELCNNEDDDCNGSVDETFDKLKDRYNCGRCGAACRSNEVCRSGACVANVEAACFDGIDDNGDGKIDCADPTCDLRPCASGCLCRNLAKSETVCSDARDNDGDGRLDCQDEDCVGGACGTGCACATDGGKAETDCSDGDDNDADGRLNCLDTDCQGRLCTQPPIFFTCTALTQCQCNDGGLVAESPPDASVGWLLCRDAIDNDCNGLTDCAEPSCDGQPCTPPDGGAFDCVCAQRTRREANCRNRFDDDGDGQADCADRDCPAGTPCRTASGDGGVCTANRTCE